MVEDYDNTLNHNWNSNFDIIKIYNIDIDGFCGIKEALENEESLILIWEREEPKEEPKEIKVELPNGTSCKMFKKGFTEGCNAIIEELKSGKKLVGIQETVSSIVKNIETNLGIAKPVKVSVADKMRTIAGWLGVEIGEEFNVLWQGKYRHKHTITEEGIIDEKGEIDNDYIGDLITNYQGYTIEKIEKKDKWVPKYAEAVWAVNEFELKGYCRRFYSATKEESIALKRGYIFQTEEEAKEDVKKRGWCTNE